MARPTKYKAEYSTDEFIQGFIDHCKEERELVTICGLAVYINVTEDTLQNWGREHKEFLGSLGRIKQVSKLQLLQGGVNNTYNSTIAKLILSANHGMSEKNITQLEGLDSIQPVINVTVAKEPS